MPTCGRGGMIGGVCRRGPRPGWVGQGDHVIVCAFGVEDRVLVGGEVRYTRQWSRMCELAGPVSEYRSAVKGVVVRVGGERAGRPVLKTD